MAKKTIFMAGDFHMGHLAAIAPPKYQTSSDRRIKKLQEELWGIYLNNIKLAGKIDVFVANGDGIDGMGQKTGGTELLHTDQLVQCKMYEEAIKVANPKHVIMTYGTLFHVGSETDFEKIVADNLGAEIKGEHSLEVNGVTFNIKHHLGSSSTPYARATAVTKENVWNIIKAENGEIDRADVFVRSHVHYHVASSDRDRLCMTLPALQGAGSKYGRRCAGTVDFGNVVFNVYDKPNKYGEKYEWHKMIKPILNQKVEKIIL